MTGTDILLVWAIGAAASIPSVASAQELESPLGSRWWILVTAALWPVEWVAMVALWVLEACRAVRR